MATWSDSRLHVLASGVSDSERDEQNSSGIDEEERSLELRQEKRQSQAMNLIRRFVTKYKTRACKK